MGCVCSKNFVVLISGSLSSFFRVFRGVRQGFSLSPYLFMLVAKALNILITKENQSQRINGFKITNLVTVTHILFVDDVFIFGSGGVE